MCAICDVNEYRKCVRVLNSPLVTQLFDILHALCNLLLVKHENLQEVCGGDTLVCFELLFTVFFNPIRDYLICFVSFTELFGQISRIEFHPIAQRLQNHQNHKFIERDLRATSLIIANRKPFNKNVNKFKLNVKKSS